jgi:hypothetical protein
MKNTDYVIIYFAVSQPLSYNQTRARARSSQAAPIYVALLDQATTLHTLATHLTYV